jgi:hypothetical protein
MTFFFFLKNGELEGKTDPFWNIDTIGRGEDIRKG